MAKSPAIWVLLSIAIAASSAPVEAASPCQPIRFKAGRFSATVRGIAPVNGTICYSLTTGSGQMASVAIRGTTILKGLAFNIDPGVENQNKVRFRTERRTYRIIVYSLFRTATVIPFALTVTVR